MDLSITKADADILVEALKQIIEHYSMARITHIQIGDDAGYKKYEEKKIRAWNLCDAIKDKLKETNNG